MEISSQASAAPAIEPARREREDALRTVAKAFEASFLSEMLKASGAGKSRSEFGGGAGEDAFSSMMVDEQAKLMVERGGIGLSEAIFESLRAREFGYGVRL
ncbi:MAG: rod-binding protein [Rhodobacteraceae bacterium]|nr:rod-binding protein [Paracoccaceae bacterium]